MSYLSMSLHVPCIWIIAMYTQSLKRSGFGELPERESSFVAPLAAVIAASSLVGITAYYFIGF